MKKSYIYQSPIIYVGLFYTLLVAWTVVCVSLLGHYIKSGWGSLGQFLMIAFILVCTGYFSLGLHYRIRVESDGDIQLTSLRRIIKVNARNIGVVEGPRFGLPIGFIRFRLEREKAYLFSVVTERKLQEILLVISKANPDIKFKSL